MADNKKEFCGLIMPISEIDGCTESHWMDVKNILTEAIEDLDMEARLVSEAEDAGVIHKRIIQNIYDDPIVVCDVSGKNPNVMFELGMRLAFDKPTIIIKDDVTNYIFDTSAIEHLEYPRDLRFNKIKEFKQSLAEKIKNTLKKSKEDPNYTTFLKHFGKFTVAKIEHNEIPANDYLIEQIESMQSSLRRLEIRANKRENVNYYEQSDNYYSWIVEKNKWYEVQDKFRVMKKELGVKSFVISNHDSEQFRLDVSFNEDQSKLSYNRVLRYLKDLLS